MIHHAHSGAPKSNQSNEVRRSTGLSVVSNAYRVSFINLSPEGRCVKDPLTYATHATGSFYHGTRADLAPGDWLTPGNRSNYADRTLSWIYFSGTLDAAVWGCELAKGEGRERIYVVEPTGAFEDDPNLTDKRFPGNPTRSYRSRAPLRVVGEVATWDPHPPERLAEMKAALARMDAKRRPEIID